MDRVKTMEDLFAYDRWANGLMLDSAGRLSQEQYTKDLGSSFPSLRDTLAHIVSSEWVWLSRWEGTSPRERPARFSTTSVDELREYLLEVETAQRAFLAGLSDTELDAVLSYALISGQPMESPLWQTLQHLINHSTYHRGQATTLLRQLGTTPPNTDLITFYRSQD